MFPFLLIFIVFLLIFAYYNKKSTEKQKSVTEDFWNKEYEANAVRKKDISSLDYITIPFEKFPQKFNTPSEEAFYALADKTILNLNGMSNTDIKLNYGTANLQCLSDYDTNFTSLVAVIPAYASELLDLGEKELAKMLLEFGVSCKADATKIYTLLAEIYSNENATSKIESLLTVAEELPEFPKEHIKRELQHYLP